MRVTGLNDIDSHYAGQTKLYPEHPINSKIVQPALGQRGALWLKPSPVRTRAQQCDV